MTKRALITGASGEIGAAISRALTAMDCEVLLHGRDATKLSQLASEIRQAGGKAGICRFDVTNADEAREALEAELEAGPIQIVVANAGIHDDAPMAGMSHAQWRRVIDVSLDGFFNTVQPLLLPMMGTRWGRVIAMSSVAGKMGNRGQVNYAAAKAGLHGAIKSLSLELASRGVTANTVAPGVIATAMSAGQFDEDRIRQLVPMKRAGRPEEVADLVAFLASERSGYISGQLISIDGGLS
ncbi:MAG: 3-oxoacyl-ACP reductase FabG [Gammaproteobacteria bacterium]|nr:3-oxoacyl-ACP reductase FabG [Gammaproteobacteria bacterium]